MNKTYKTLYSRDSKGKIREWFMEQKDGAYRTHSGVQDGKTVISEWTVVEGKNIGKTNETSLVEQAASEVESKYDKQLKTGYSDTLKGVDEGCSYIEPMLAKHYKDYSSKINFAKENWGIQRKLNGNRCVATTDVLKTRKGEVYLCVPHINKALEKFFKKYPDAVLDGELYNRKLRQTLNELSKLVRRTVHITAEDLKRSEEIVEYHIYDGWGFDGLGIDASYSKRKEWIDKNVIGKYDYVKEVETYPIKSVDDMNKKFKEFVDDNEEGGILRNLDKGYENKRSKYLLKLKQEMDDECIILKVIEGTGNWSGAAKTASVKWGKVEFDCTFKGPYEELVEVLKNKKNWEGKEVTFQYLELTGLGTPNSGRIDIHNCFKTDK